MAEENGILRVQHIRRAPLRIGLLFTIINRQIQIEVPREYAGSVQVETKNGAIRLEEMKQLAQVGCHARNGAVRLAGCCVQALAIEARNGAVKLEDCETGSLAVQAFNGAVHLQRCAGGSAKVQGHNGAVRLGRLPVCPAFGAGQPERRHTGAGKRPGRLHPPAEQKWKHHGRDS